MCSSQTSLLRLYPHSLRDPKQDIAYRAAFCIGCSAATGDEVAGSGQVRALGVADLVGDLGEVVCGLRIGGVAEILGELARVVQMHGLKVSSSAVRNFVLLEQGAREACTERRYGSAAGPANTNSRKERAWGPPAGRMCRPLQYMHSKNHFADPNTMVQAQRLVQ